MIRLKKQLPTLASFIMFLINVAGKGNFVIVVDNEDRENEGDLVIAAQDCSMEKMAFMVRYTR